MTRHRMSADETTREWTHFYVRLHDGRRYQALRAIESLADMELTWITQRLAAELERRRMLRDALKKGRNARVNSAAH